MACFETGVVSHSSLGLEKQIRPGWGPAGGWEAGGGWTPEVDAAGLPLPRTPHPDNGPPCSHSDRGWSERGGGKKHRQNELICVFFQPSNRGCSQSIGHDLQKKRVPRVETETFPSPLSKIYVITLLPMILFCLLRVGPMWDTWSVLFFYFSTLYLSGNW